MKNVFVALTEIKVDGTGVKTMSCWVNMSRVQEMRLDDLVDVPGKSTVTRLSMNIPNYEIVVEEHPEMILHRLDQLNGEPVR